MRVEFKKKGKKPTRIDAVLEMIDKALNWVKNDGLFFIGDEMPTEQPRCACIPHLLRALALTVDHVKKRPPATAGGNAAGVDWRTWLLRVFRLATAGTPPPSPLFPLPLPLPLSVSTELLHSQSVYHRSAFRLIATLEVLIRFQFHFHVFFQRALYTHSQCAADRFYEWM